MTEDPRVADLQTAFAEQFAAMEVLRDFARENRPSSPPSPDIAGALIMATYARGTKTFQASFRLALAGYGAQAGMLNRSLFEDMIVAHWIRLNPSEAPELFERHWQHTLEDVGGKYEKYGREEEVADWPDLSNDERAALADEFERKHHWTKRSLYQLVKDVEHEWPDETTDRRMLWQIFDIAHRFNNLLLHHSYFGLALAATAVPGGVQWDVGPSDKHIHGALQVAWFSYAHLVSLVVDDDAYRALTDLFAEQLPAFAHVRAPDGPEPR